MTTDSTTSLAYTETVSNEIVKHVRVTLTHDHEGYDVTTNWATCARSGRLAHDADDCPKLTAPSPDR